MSARRPRIVLSVWWRRVLRRSRSSRRGAGRRGSRDVTALGLA